MGLFTQKRGYSRSDSLAAAAEARSKRRWKLAIRHYHEVLEHEPRDPDVHAKLAPLFVKTAEPNDAWRSFEIAAEGYRNKGFDQRAAGVYASAASLLPQRVDAWERLAALQLTRGLRHDALKTLLSGSGHFDRKASLPTAVRLLTSAFQIEPWNFGVSIALARALRRTGDKEHATQILNELVSRTSGKSRRAVRAALFRTRPTPAAAWRWLRAT